MRSRLGVPPQPEINGVALAIALLEAREGDKDIELAIEQLRLFCEFSRRFNKRPMKWHDFLKMKRIEKGNEDGR